ncbi:MAG: hypothetical protein H7844_10885 [Nitrospirae bacterium YQR-1]
MIKLGDVVLSNDLTWPNRFEWSGVSETVEKTLSGGLVIYGGEVTGRSIDLTGDTDYGWITYEDLRTLVAMAGASGETYELQFNNDTYTVRFRQEDAPVLDFTPVTNMSGYDDYDYFYGTIKLMEVEQE